MSVSEEREEFERWFEGIAAPYPNWFKRDDAGNGDYIMNYVDCCWQAWLARAQLGQTASYS